jgi:hypothetical protein
VIAATLPLAGRIGPVPLKLWVDVWLLFNLPQKEIGAALAALLTAVARVEPDLVPGAFLPAVPRLRGDGRRSAVLVVAKLQFEMTVREFLPFMMECLADREHDLKAAVAPLLSHFLQLAGAQDAVREAADELPPTTRGLILAQLTNGTLFESKPTPAQKALREEKIDPMLPLWVINGAKDISVLFSVLTGVAEKFFVLPVASTEPSDVAVVAHKFLTAANTDFESASLVLDVYFLWWAAQSLAVSDSDLIALSSDFFMRLLAVVESNQRRLSEFELKIGLPVALERTGRRYDGGPGVVVKLRAVSPPTPFAAVLIGTVSAAVSVPALRAGCDLLSDVLADARVDDLRPELGRMAAHLQEITRVAPDPDFAASSERLIGLFRVPSARSRCAMHSAVILRLKSPAAQVYGWIVSLGSDDPVALVPTLREIRKQFAADARVFEPHVETMALLLLNLLHVHFNADEMNVRLCKFIAFCVLKMFEGTTIKERIDAIVVQQLLYELVTHLSNGLSEPDLHAWMTAVVQRLIEDCTQRTLISLLVLIGDFDARSQVSAKWVKLAVKCFEQCGARVCDAGQADDGQAAIEALEQFLQTVTIERIRAEKFGDRIIGVFRGFLGKAAEKWPNLFGSRDFRNTIPIALALTEAPEHPKRRMPP